MKEMLLMLVKFFTTHFSTEWPAYADYAAVYGWLAASSGLAALLALVFVLLKREPSKTAIVAIVQVFLVWGIPFVVPQFIAA